MDRQTVYFGQVPLETDLLHAQQNAMVALGWVVQAFNGLSQNAGGFATAVDGFNCTPTTPATLSVILTPGAIYQLENLEATSWSSLPANITSSIVKQGIQQNPVTFGITPPATIGFSQVFMIEVQYADLDTGLVTLPYFDAALPSVPFMGPANSGTAQNTVRQGIVATQVKAGIAATTGTQVAPTADAGWTGLFLITVAYGQATITAGNIATINASPWIPTKLYGIPFGVLSGGWIYANDTGSANAYAASLAFPGYVITTLNPGMQVRIKIANTNTGASTFNWNGTGAASILRGNLAALQANDLTAGAIVDLTYDGTHWQISNYLGIGGSPTNNFFSTTGLPYCVDSSGTPNTITAPFSPAITGPQMVAGLTVAVKLANTNTAATTITVNANAAVNIINSDGSALQPHDMLVGTILILEHDGTSFRLINERSPNVALKQLWVDGSGQTLPNGVLTLITCLTTVVVNTLLTSTWNGTTLTIGTGEDGLWGFAYDLQLGPVPGGTTITGSWVILDRYRGGVHNQFTIQETGQNVQPDGGSLIVDLQVGDLVTFYGYAAGYNFPIQPTAYMLGYRLIGLH